MINDDKVRYLAIIPARGGSKRLPRKNVLPLQGKPLIAWTIESALQSQYIDTVCVSSDDEEILAIAEEYKILTVNRPNELATDTATTFDAVKHSIDLISEKYEYIVLLQPTSPLRTAKHIDEAIALLEQKKADAVVSVCEMEHSPLWSNTLHDDGSMEGFLSDEVFQRSQDLPTYYRLNGAIYICRTNSLLSEKTFFLSEKIFAYVMDREISIDIDNQIDFYTAESILRSKA